MYRCAFTGSEIVRALLPSLRVVVGVCVVSLTLAACIDVKVPKYERPNTPEKTAFSTFDTSKVAASDTIQPDW